MYYIIARWIYFIEGRSSNWCIYILVLKEIPFWHNIEKIPWDSFVPARCLPKSTICACDMLYTEEHVSKIVLHFFKSQNVKTSTREAFSKSHMAIVMCDEKSNAQSLCSSLVDLSIGEVFSCDKCDRSLRPTTLSLGWDAVRRVRPPAYAHPLYTIQLEDFTPTSLFPVEEDFLLWWMRP